MNELPRNLAVDFMFTLLYAICQELHGLFRQFGENCSQSFEKCKKLFHFFDYTQIPKWVYMVPLHSLNGSTVIAAAALLLAYKLKRKKL